MTRNSDLPEHLIDEIIEAIRTVLPEDTLITKESPRLVEYQSRVVVNNQRGRYSRVIGRYAQTSVRNRDGISPVSIAWVVWNNLDIVLTMSRQSGTPWPADVAVSMQAYAQPTPDGNAISAWLMHTDTMERIELPLISLDGVEMEPPRGFRLPFRLPNRYELPEDGSPVTSPENRL
jgi:hypothetical protein